LFTENIISTIRLIYVQTITTATTAQKKKRGRRRRELSKKVGKIYTDIEREIEVYIGTGC
jgi:hypothetical protein